MPPFVTRLSLLLALLLPAAHAAKITAVTTEFPPFQSQQPSQWGLALALSKALAQRNGDTLDIRFLPWPRAYQIAETTPDTLIFCLARTPDRESRYGWIGEVAPNDVSLWRLASRPEVNPTSLEEAKRWRLGVTAQDMKARYLAQKGFVDNLNLQESPDDLSNLRKLLAKRIDLLPFSNRIVLDYLLKKEGQSPTQLVPVLHLPELSGSLYLAFSPGSNGERTRRYAANYQQLRKEGFMTQQRQKLGLAPETQGNQ